jgi:hypothetical protein
LVAALELELALEDGFDEPQPAMTRQASRGITVIARRRRMKTSMVVDISALGVGQKRPASVGDGRPSDRPMHADRRARPRSGERQVLNKALPAYWHGEAPASRRVATGADAAGTGRVQQPGGQGRTRDQSSHVAGSEVPRYISTPLR